jgi:hypothetical protein
MTDPADPADPEDDLLVAFARRLLEREGADGEGAGEVADGVARASDRLSSHLGRVIGHLGMSALFVRSLMLTRASHPWMVGDPHGPAGERWQALRACMEAHGPDPARAASRCLVGLVGEGLVLRLLAEVWPDDLPTRTKEQTP